MRVEFVFADYLAKRIARSDALGDLTNASAHPLARPGLALVLGGFAWGLYARLEIECSQYSERHSEPWRGAVPRL